MEGRETLLSPCPPFGSAPYLSSADNICCLIANILTLSSLQFSLYWRKRWLPGLEDGSGIDVWWSSQHVHIIWIASLFPEGVALMWSVVMEMLLHGFSWTQNQRKDQTLPRAEDIFLPDTESLKMFAEIGGVQLRCGQIRLYLKGVALILLGMLTICS